MAGVTQVCHCPEKEDPAYGSYPVQQNEWRPAGHASPRVVTFSDTVETSGPTPPHIKRHFRDLLLFWLLLLLGLAAVPLPTQASSFHLSRLHLSVDLLRVSLVNVQHFAAFLPFSGDCASTCPDRRREEAEPRKERNMGAWAKSRRGPSSPLFLHSGSGYLRRTVSEEMTPQLFGIAV